MESQMTRPYDHDQAEDPIRIHHPEEEEHQEKGATKVLRKVKEKAKKIKNTLTKHGHGHEHNHDHVVEEEEEDDDYDEQDPKVHGASVYESSAHRGDVAGQPKSLSHPGDTNIQAPDEIIPPGSNVFPVVSSHNTRPIEPEPLREASYGHEALSHPVISDREERREATSHPLKVSDLSDREVSREAHREPMDTPVSLLTATEDLSRTFAAGEDEYLGGQRKVNDERPIRLEEDPRAPGGGSDYLSGASNYQSKVTDPIQKGGGEAGVPEIAESLGRMKVTDESRDRKSGLRFERDSPTRSHEFGLKNESGIDKNSPTVLGGGSIAGFGEDFPTRSHELGLKNESGDGNNTLTGVGGESGTGLGADFPVSSHEIGLKDSGIDKDSPAGSYGYGEESEAGLVKKFPARNDDVEVETELRRNLPTGTHDQFSPELSRPKERDEEMKDQTQEPKPSTYTGKIASATSAITNKAMAAKDAVASRLGYSGKTTGDGGQHESPIVDETPRSATGYGQKLAGTVAEKLTPVYEKVKETGSTVMTKLPLPGSGSGAKETHQGVDKGVSARDYMAEKLTPGEEDKALSEFIAEKLHIGGGGGEKKTTTTKEVEVTVGKSPSDQISEERERGERVPEEGKGGGGGGGMVGKIKGWFGGTTEEMKPKSSDSVEESSQSLGSTDGTMRFSDSGGGGAVPVERGLQESGN